MAMITIWHNPRCSKSRQTLALLEERGGALNVRRYLEDPPSAEEIRGALDALGKQAIEIIRRGEAAFKDNKLDKSSPQEELIAAMAEAPILIERPIVFHAGRAAIGRPPEAVLDIL